LTKSIDLGIARSGVRVKAQWVIKPGDGTPDPH
jgi:hypothetical protein